MTPAKRLAAADAEQASSALTKFRIAVVGATGNVGRELLNLLRELRIPAGQISAVASAKSAGKEISYGEKDILIAQDLDKFDFSSTDIVLASAGGDISAQFAQRAVDAGALVIDNSSHFRMDHDVPLIVPECNLEAAKNWRKRGIIANPNCSTIQMVVALADLHHLFKVKQVSVATYQSVSGAGKAAMDELFDQSRKIFVHQEPENKALPRQIAFNVIPQIDTFVVQDNVQDVSKEELKMQNETKKILDNNIAVEAICVRVPVFVGHSEAIFVECEKAVDLQVLRGAWAQNPSINLAVPKDYHTPVECSRSDQVFVSRLRSYANDPKRITFWCVSDNLLKGAALNALQIAEAMASKNWITPKV